MSNLDEDIPSILDEIENPSMEDSAERLSETQFDESVLSSEMNLYQGVLNCSMDEITVDEPHIIVYSHSPGFESGQTGYGRVRGRKPVPRRDPVHGVKRNNFVDTGIVPLKVQDAETLPGPHYSDHLELVIEYDGFEMLEDQPVTLSVIPYDPGKVNDIDIDEVFDRYSAENEIHRTDLV